MNPTSDAAEFTLEPNSNGVAHLGRIKKSGISILSDEFPAEVQGLKRMNLAADLLQRLLKDEIKVRYARNVGRRVR